MFEMFVVLLIDSIGCYDAVNVKQFVSALLHSLFVIIGYLLLLGIAFVIISYVRH